MQQILLEFLLSVNFNDTEPNKVIALLGKTRLWIQIRAIYRHLFDTLLSI